MSFSNLEDKEDKPKKTRISSPTRFNNKSALKKELRILIECLGFGHGKYKEFPQYKIQNSSHLKARINELIDLISK